MTDTDTPRINVTMTDRAPISIGKADWPLIASARGFSGEHRCQSATVWYLCVRLHADGRALVYGGHREGPGGSHSGFREVWSGFLVASADEIVGAIRRVEELLGVPGLGDECISDLPAEQLE